jgi:hypothetical protein
MVLAGLILLLSAQALDSPPPVPKPVAPPVDNPLAPAAGADRMRQSR